MTPTFDPADLPYSVHAVWHLNEAAAPRKATCHVIPGYTGLEHLPDMIAIRYLAGKEEREQVVVDHVCRKRRWHITARDARGASLGQIATDDDTLMPTLAHALQGAVTPAGTVAQVEVHDTDTKTTNVIPAEPRPEPEPAATVYLLTIACVRPDSDRSGDITVLLRSLADDRSSARLCVLSRVADVEAAGGSESTGLGAPVSIEDLAVSFIHDQVPIGVRQVSLATEVGAPPHHVCIGLDAFETEAVRGVAVVASVLVTPAAVVVDLPASRPGRIWQRESLQAKEVFSGGLVAQCLEFAVPVNAVSCALFPGFPSLEVLPTVDPDHAGIRFHLASASTAEGDEVAVSDVAFHLHVTSRLGEGLAGLGLAAPDGEFLLLVLGHSLPLPAGSHASCGEVGRPTRMVVRVVDPCPRRRRQRGYRLARKQASTAAAGRILQHQNAVLGMMTSAAPALSSHRQNRLRPSAVALCA